MTTSPALAALALREGQLDAVAELVRRRTELDLALRAQLVELWETTKAGEQRYVADELAVVLAESPRTTQNWIGDALCLAAYPEVKALVESGVWTIRHADAVMDELAGLTRDNRRRALELVLGQKAARTPHELRKATRAAVYLVDADAAQRAADKAKTDRAVTLHDERNGAGSLVMTGPKAAVAAAMAGLDALCGVKAPEDTRTLLQRRFDALLGLITGEITAVGGQVQLLVSLATLQGDDAPAEVPGLGFITAQEARDLVADAAEIRRSVVDAHGQLAGVDSTVARPEPAADVAAEPLLTDEVEPAPVVDDVDAAEEWLPRAAGEAPFQAQADWADYCAPVTGDSTPEQDRAQAHLRAILAVLIEQEQTTGRRVNDAHVRIEPDRVLIHYRNDPHDPPPDGGPGGPGGSDPPRGPTQPLPAGYVDDRRAQRERDAGLGLPTDPTEAARTLRQQWLRRQQPSFALPPLPPREEPKVWPAPTRNDLDWWDQHPDRTLAHTLIEEALPARPAAPAPPQGWPTPPPRPKAWSAEALTNCIATLLARPAPAAPGPSSSYLFRGPLARFIKLRDQSCRFPGCTRLAQRCDTDHLTIWPYGPTCVDNGNSMCEQHHKAKHAVFTVTALANGGLRWALPTGHQADVPPRQLLRGW